VSLLIAVAQEGHAAGEKLTLGVEERAHSGRLPQAPAAPREDESSVAGLPEGRGRRASAIAAARTVELVSGVRPPRAAGTGTSETGRRRVARGRNVAALTDAPVAPTARPLWRALRRGFAVLPGLGAALCACA